MCTFGRGCNPRKTLLRLLREDFAAQMFACSCIVRNISCSTSCPYCKCCGFLTKKVRCCQCSCDRTCCRKETFLKHRKQIYLEERVWPYNVPSVLNIVKWLKCKSRGWIQPASLRKEEEERSPLTPEKSCAFFLTGYIFHMQGMFLNGSVVSQ